MGVAPERACWNPATSRRGQSLWWFGSPVASPWTLRSPEVFLSPSSWCNLVMSWSLERLSQGPESLCLLLPGLIVGSYMEYVHLSICHHRLLTGGCWPHGAFSLFPF